jgi:hypothetical protein
MTQPVSPADRFEYTSTPPANADLVIDASVTEKGQLLELFARALRFPDYFGMNWNAFLDCLSDLSWLEQPEVVVDHRELPSLSSGERHTYLECLQDALERMEGREPPRLRVVFREVDREAVGAALREVPSPALVEFARTLVQQVRDAAIRNCDALLEPHARSAAARRWKGLGAASADLRVVIPDAVDETVFGVLQAIDQGLLRMKYVCRDGREIDLTEEGQGELSGWYMGSGGWRALFSAERFVDDVADLGG